MPSEILRKKLHIEGWVGLENTYCYATLKKFCFWLALGLVAFVPLDLSFSKVSNPTLTDTIWTRFFPALCYLALAAALQVKTLASNKNAFIVFKALFLIFTAFVYTIQYKYVYDFSDRQRFYSPFFIPGAVYVTRIGSRASFLFFGICIAIWAVFFIAPETVQKDINYLLFAALFTFVLKNNNEAQASMYLSHAELMQTKEQLFQSEKLAMLGEIAAGFAHEFKNILNSTSTGMMAIKTLVARNKIEEISSTVSIVQEACSRGATIIDSIAKANTFRDAEIPFNIYALIETVMFLRKGSMFEDFVVENKVPKGQIIHANESAIYGTLMNLVRYIAESNKETHARMIMIAYEEGAPQPVLAFYTRKDFNFDSLNSDRGLSHAMDHLRSKGGDIVLSPTAPNKIEIVLPRIA